MTLVLRVMRFIAVRSRNDAMVERMPIAPRDQHHHGLFHLVANYATYEHFAILTHLSPLDTRPLLTENREHSGDFVSHFTNL